jgi:hypothetical protein
LPTTLRFTFIIALAITLSGCEGTAPEPAGTAAPEATAQPNVLQTQTDALQKAKDVQAEMDAAEAKRRAAIEEAAGG